jgi:hypothetical protein
MPVSGTHNAQTCKQPTSQLINTEQAEPRACRACVAHSARGARALWEARTFA